MVSIVSQHGSPRDVAQAAHLKCGLVLLRRARCYAEKLGRDPWDFALKIATMRRAGLSHSDLRWLICKAWVEHVREVFTRGRQQRRFRHSGSLSLTKRSCFVLTAAGVRGAKSSPAVESLPVAAVEIAPVRRASANGSANGRTPVPQWDRDRQELRLGAVVVKEFKLSSPNQETILMAFQKEGWPPRIDDPLPPHAGVDPKRRLYETIKSLNRNQKQRWLLFMGDGTGEGIRWQVIQPQEEDDTDTSAEQ
jgi:hypothetical protein